MRVGTIYFDADIGITKIKWSDDFLNDDYVVKMDALNDSERIISMAIEEVKVKYRKEKVLL